MRVTPLFPSLVELSCGKLTYVHGVSQNIPNPPCFPYMCTVALHSHSHAYLEWQPIILAVRWQNWIMILNPALKALFFFCKVIFVPNHSEWFCNYLEREFFFSEFGILNCIMQLHRFDAIMCQKLSKHSGNKPICCTIGHILPSLIGIGSMNLPVYCRNFEL